MLPYPLKLLLKFVFAILFGEGVPALAKARLLLAFVKRREQPLYYRAA
jgi:hypothetical protein